MWKTSLRRHVYRPARVVSAQRLHLRLQLLMLMTNDDRKLTMSVDNIKRNAAVAVWSVDD